MEAEQQQQPDGEEAATRAGYESAFAAVKDKPCRVAEMVVLGLARTKLSVVQRELQRVRGATTLEEIKDALLEAYVELVGLNVFEVVDLVLDEGGEVRAPPRGSHTAAAAAAGAARARQARARGVLAPPPSATRARCRRCRATRAT